MIVNLLAWNNSLKPIVEITEEIGGQKWVTISTIRLLLHKLLEVHLKCEDLDLKLTKDMKTAMIKNLTDRYVQGALMFFNISTFVDPRFKLPSFLTDGEKQPLLEQEVIDDTIVTAKKKQKMQQKNN